MRCNDARLNVLFSAEESSGEYQTAASHVEACPRCQQRMMQLSGDDGQWNEVLDTLRADGLTETYDVPNSSVVISIESSGEEEFGECEPISLDFLAPPSHPEMLGRIGRYEVERVIGSGGMGIVLKGFDTELHRVVAVKVLKPHLAHNGAARRRFAREAQSAAAIVHEHVIPIYDVSSDAEMPYLVMQYVSGQSLQSRVDERGPLDPKEILRIARQAAAGLAAAHAQGVVHRDVKPANILLEDSVERVMISDFGLARTVDDATLTRTGVVAGTPHYMSPEQATGQSVDQRSDLFSLGSVIYFMCTGRPPFRAEHALAILSRIRHDAHRPVDEVNREIPAELAEIVDQLLAKEPHQRFRDATAVEQTLESLLARMQNGKRAPHIRWRRSWRRWQKFVKQTVWISSISAACLLTGAGMTWWQLAGVRTSVSRTDRAGESATQPEALPSPEAENNAMTLPELPPDDFARGLNEVQNSMLRIEAEWAGKPRWLKLDSQVEISNWSRELQRLRDAMERMKQGLSVSIDQLQPTISEPVQRKDQ